MGGCCLLALFLTIGPRFVLFLSWLLSWGWYDAFESSLIAFVCWLFLPWTSLAYMYTFFHNGGQIEGQYLLLMIAAVVVDVLSMLSGGSSSSDDGESE